MNRWAAGVVAALLLLIHACADEGGADGSGGGAGDASGGSSGDGGSAGASGADDGGSAGSSLAGSAGAAGGSAALSGSCEAYAESYCARLSECAPHYVRRTYEDGDTCVPILTLACVGDVADGIGVIDLADCTEAIDDASCEELLGDPLPACARTPGVHPAGAPCHSAAQCDTGSCAFSGNPCGTCASTLAAQSPCADSEQQCGTGLGCDFDGTGLCQPLQRRELNESCDVFVALCAPGLFCSSDATCRPYIGDGGSCAAEPGGCDPRRALFCVEEVCGPLDVFVQPGEACGVGDSPFPRCGDPLYCDPDTNECVPRAQVGESCSPDPVAGSTCDVNLICGEGTCLTYEDLCL